MLRNLGSATCIPADFPDDETRWAWWARHIYFNRYITAPKPVYPLLLSLVQDKDYFVLTTNVDHQFQMAGFYKSRLFYTQGDYGLFQSIEPVNRRTYDNQSWVMQAMEAQGFVRNVEGVFDLPGSGKLLMRLPSDLIPTCPDDGSPVTTNLRADDSFVEDEGWHQAANRYEQFLDSHGTGRILYLELGVGANTPVLLALSTRGTKKTRKMDVFKQETGFGEDVILAERRCA